MVNQQNPAGIGSFRGPELRTSVAALVAFTLEVLGDFASDPSVQVIRVERGLTQELCIKLNAKAWATGIPLHFFEGPMEDIRRGDSPAADIGVIPMGSVSSADRQNERVLFALEAKLLSSHLPPSRKQEYLVGHSVNRRYRPCGGVERFKVGIHGRNLESAAIVGYVLDGTFNNWHQTINSWIDDYIAGNCVVGSNATWAINDKITRDSRHVSTGTAKFQSNNGRSTGSIVLHHLWVDLTGTTNGHP